MTSGETAAGRHPALVVETMARIVAQAERSLLPAERVRKAAMHAAAANWNDMRVARYLKLAPAPAPPAPAVRAPEVLVGALPARPAPPQRFESSGTRHPVHAPTADVCWRRSLGPTSGAGRSTFW